MTTALSAAAVAAHCRDDKPARRRRSPSGSRRAPHYSLTVLEDGSEYTEDQVELLLAMERYIRTTGRPFPSFTEVLAVAQSLGYRKVPAAPVPPASE